MKTLAGFTYVLCCVFLLSSLGKSKLLDTLPPKKRLALFLSCFILPAIYLAPYYFGLVPANFNLPGWVTWMPFAVLALAVMIIRLFYPQHQQRFGPILAKILIGMLLAYNFLPFIAGIIQRW